jgi:hypothetical protein
MRPDTGIVTSSKVPTLERAKEEFRRNWVRVVGAHQHPG